MKKNGGIRERGEGKDSFLFNLRKSHRMKLLSGDSPVVDEDKW